MYNTPSCTGQVLGTENVQHALMYDLIMCTVIIMDIIIWPLLPCCYILCRFSIGIFLCMNGVFALLAKPTRCKLV